jgi:hypothetical protein
MYTNTSSRSLLLVVPNHSIQRSHTAYAHCHEICETDKLISITCMTLKCNCILKNRDFYTTLHIVKVLSAWENGLKNGYLVDRKGDNIRIDRKEINCEDKK